MSEPNEWADLVAWLQGYEGFVCLLEPRDVPGQYASSSKIISDCQVPVVGYSPPEPSRYVPA